MLQAGEPGKTRMYVQSQLQQEEEVVEAPWKHEGNYGADLIALDV